MKNEFVSYSQALALKQLGFDDPCLGCYDEKGVFGLTVMSIKDYYTNTKEDTWNCSAPLKSQVFRWFREKHNLHFPIMIQHGIWYFDRFSTEGYKTYEEVEDACIDKLIEIVKKQQQEVKQEIEKL